MAKKLFSGKTMINGRGKEVPVEMIRKDHIKRNAVVDKIFARAGSLEYKMSAVKGKIQNDIELYQSFWKKFNKAENIEDLVNLTLSNYSNTRKVVVKTQDIIQLDDTRQLAEAKIKNCVRRWGKDAHPFLITIVDELFKTNKEGFVNVTELRALKQYPIEEKEWKEAMELLSNAEIAVGKRQYITLYYREDIKSKWKIVNLNFSSAESNS